MNQATRDEVNFIKTLGTHTARGRKLEKSDMVLDYIKALPQRKNWGEINREVVTQFARKYYTHLTAPVQQDQDADLTLACHLNMASPPSLLQVV